MQKYLTIIILTFSCLLFSQKQEEEIINSFIKNQRLAHKIYVISKFIETSSTIKLNEIKDEPIMINIHPSYIENGKDKNLKGFFTVRISRIYKEKETENYKCLKLSDNKFLSISLDKEIDKKLITEKNNNCKIVLPVTNISNIPMPNSYFDFSMDENGFVYLSEVATFDTLEYLKLEFIDLLN